MAKRGGNMAKIRWQRCQAPRGTWPKVTPRNVGHVGHVGHVPNPRFTLNSPHGAARSRWPARTARTKRANMAKVANMAKAANMAKVANMAKQHTPTLYYSFFSLSSVRTHGICAPTSSRPSRL